ncbi:MAG: hypothetical protein A4E56_00419 [Pelotomaculum sp. PtaU1.Bin065]|nr:MAG: hypothetical protein A4E56_00419 [Pelotomaculum sp. PtaU1.Bin065]
MLKNKSLILIVTILIMSFSYLPAEAALIGDGINYSIPTGGSHYYNGETFLTITASSDKKIIGLHPYFGFYRNNYSIKFYICCYADDVLIYTSPELMVTDNDYTYRDMYIPVNNGASKVQFKLITESSISIYSGRYNGGYYNMGIDVADNETIIEARNAANTAASKAQTTINQTIDGGVSAASWAHQSFDKANAASQDVAYIKNTQIPSILTKIDNINNTIASDNVPPVIQKVAGKNGATCTTSGIFNIVVSATDNNSGQLWAQARVDEGSWTSWFNIPQSFIPLTLSAAGSHTITVNVKDVSGNISSTSMTAFRI